MYFRTAKAKRIQFVDFASFDFSCALPILALDIHRDLEGDVSRYFEPYTDDHNKVFIHKATDPIDTGIFGNDFKPRWCDRLGEYTRGFTCAK